MQIWCCLLPLGLSSDTADVEYLVTLAVAVIAMLLLVRNGADAICGSRAGVVNLYSIVTVIFSYRYTIHWCNWCVVS